MNVSSGTCSQDFEKHSSFTLELSIDELAAVEGWRTANELPSTSHALRELVRLGLLSEISKIHSVVVSVRDAIGKEQVAESPIKESCGS